MTEAVVGLLERTWSSIGDVCTGLTEEEWQQPTTLPGWRVKDVISHLIGTERMLAGEPDPEVTLSDRPYVRNDIGRRNEKWILERRACPGDTLLDEFRDVTKRRLAALSGMSSHDFDRVVPTPEGNAPYRQFMFIRVFDSYIHEQDIRTALDRPGHLDGPVVDATLEKIRHAAGYVVGKKAAAPTGSTIVFAVTGPTAAIVPVHVAGRAHLMDDVPTEPTASLVMNTSTYMALSCGRQTAGDALATGALTLAGDTSLGRAVAENMAFTI